MSDHAKLLTQLRTFLYIAFDVKTIESITHDAADLIEQQAARIAAEPKTKRLVFTDPGHGIFKADSPIGKFSVWSINGRPWRAEREVIGGHYVIIGGFATESEARAACQAEFDRIYAEMTEAPMVTT